MAEDNTPLLTEILASTSENQRYTNFGFRILSVHVSNWTALKTWFGNYFQSAAMEITRNYHERNSELSDVVAGPGKTITEEISRESHSETMKDKIYLCGYMKMEIRGDYGNLYFKADLASEKSGALLQHVLDMVKPRILDCIEVKQVTPSIRDEEEVKQLMLKSPYIAQLQEVLKTYIAAQAPGAEDLGKH